MEARCAVVAVLACAGCRDLLGFEDVVENTEVRFHLTRSNVENAADESPVVIAQAPSLDGVDVRLADGSEAALELTGDGTVVFRSPLGERYRIVLAAADRAVELQSQARDLLYRDIAFGRADAAATPPNTSLRYATSAGGDGYAVNVSGLWAGSDFVSANQEGIVDVDWTRAHQFTGAPAPLVSATRNDRVHLLRFKVDTVGPTAINHVVAAQVDQVDMVGGGTVALGDRLAAVTNQTVQISGDLPGTRDRCDAADGFANAELTAVAVIAIANPVAARPDRGFLLAFASPGLVEVPLDFQLPVPQVFPTPTTVLFNIARTRKVTTPMGTVTLGCELQSYMPLAPGATSLALTVDVGFPTGFTIDDVGLAADDAVVPITGRELAIEWTTTGPAEVFEVLLKDVSRGSLVRQYSTDEPRVAIDSALLDPSGVYSVQVFARRGVAGDFTTPPIPLTLAVTASPTFRITN